MASAGTSAEDENSLFRLSGTRSVSTDITAEDVVSNFFFDLRFFFGGIKGAVERSSCVTDPEPSVSLSETAVGSGTARNAGCFAFEGDFLFLSDFLFVS